jgi:hypothetical protein
MATSGVANFTPPITTLIRMAWIKMDIIAEDEEPTAAMYEEGQFTVNAMVKAWEATGLHVWTEEEYIQFLQPLQAEYQLGGTTLDQSSLADSWARLTLAQPAAAGAGTITLENAAFVTSGINLGVILSNGATFWTTANGAPAGNVVTLAADLPSAAVSGAYVLAYPPSSIAPRVLKLPKARLLTLSSMTEIPMTVMSRQEYEDLPQKNTAPGTPTQFFYSPRRDTGLLYVWAVANTSAWAVRFTGYRSIQDYVDPTNTSDFPQEWASAILWNLALELTPGKSVPEPTYNRIKERAGFYFDLLTSYDRESEPIQFGMDSWMYDTE